jgi:hypothetical protein
MMASFAPKKTFSEKKRCCYESFFTVTTYSLWIMLLFCNIFVTVTSLRCSSEVSKT